MKEYIVKNNYGMLKFSEGEHVLVVDGTMNENGEVKVYKMDCDGDILLNDKGNKVTYSVSMSRLVPADIHNLSRDAGVIEQRIMNKTFTDESIDEAADAIKTLKDFTKVTQELRAKLGSIFDKIMNKINLVTTSADSYDSKVYTKALGEAKSLVAYLNDKPMTEITKLHKTLVKTETEETFNPESILD